MIASLLVFALFAVGLWGVFARRNLIKKVIALGILNTAVVLLFITLGSTSGADAPIVSGVRGDPVDPLPQALMLTAIVVGVCVTALGLALVERLYRLFGTTDIAQIERKVRDEDG